ncbi:MAG: hypothetical protein K2X66_15235 [Cyanobacteria bacterium]|nr:hypothetical protein [Cyanobacteriota bacterium]
MRLLTPSTTFGASFTFNTHPNLSSQQYQKTATMAGVVEQAQKRIKNIPDKLDPLTIDVLVKATEVVGTIKTTANGEVSLKLKEKDQTPEGFIEALLHIAETIATTLEDPKVRTEKYLKDLTHELMTCIGVVASANVVNVKKNRTDVDINCGESTFRVSHYAQPGLGTQVYTIQKLNPQGEPEKEIIRLTTAGKGSPSLTPNFEIERRGEPDSTGQVITEVMGITYKPASDIYQYSFSPYYGGPELKSDPKMVEKLDKLKQGFATLIRTIESKDSHIFKRP